MSKRVYDIAIIGGSLGGCAAAMSALDPHDAALRVCLVVAESWPGGQVTAQGVAPLDEHPHIETFGATGRYHGFRQRVRDFYHRRYGAPLVMAQSVLGPYMPLNPGNGWVSRLCFSPQVGKAMLEAMLPRALDIYHKCTAVSAVRVNQTVTTVTCADASGQTFEIHARFVLDATDTGDLLPLTGTAYVTGAESVHDTGEAHAAAEPRPNETQGFTFCFAVEYCVGENHTITPPPEYAYFREHQPYTLSPMGRDGEPVIYKMFDISTQGNLPFWSYRRIHDGALLGGNDIALINWISNDYHGGNILDAAPEERQRHIDAAKALSLGFLYWLQTECPRDDGGTGYPELKLRPDIMGTDDGLSQSPYIRESRRILGKQRIAAHNISAEANAGARAKHFSDSVGIGWYAMDLHPCVDNPTVSMYAPTRPFQVPLGALIPQGRDNLLAACKNIATTHLTNGAYRLQPIEWAIGEAAGIIATFCHRHGLTLPALYADAWQVWRLQYELVRQGCPIFWALDVPVSHPLFVPTQLLLVRDVIVPHSARWSRLQIGVDEALGDSVDIAKLRMIAQELNAHGAAVDLQALSPELTWADVCVLFAEPLAQTLV